MKNTLELVFKLIQDTAIREKREIKGIEMGGAETKHLLLADHMTSNRKIRMPAENFLS